MLQLIEQWNYIKSYPCVMLVAQSGFPQAESISYNIIFDSEEPCWYNQY